MIVSEKFVFIHMHKTGGQFVLRALLDFVPDCRSIGYHYPLHLLPRQFESLPVFGFVRNPWDWYVSWYHFNQPRPMMNPLFRVMSDEGKLGFDMTIERMLRFGSKDKDAVNRIDELRNMLPDSLEGNRGIGLTKNCLNNAVGGFYSWQFKRMYSMDFDTAGSIRFGKMENLRADLAKILKNMGVKMTPQLTGYIETAMPVNASDRGRYQDYYSEELKQHVAESEKELISHFGYVF